MADSFNKKEREKKKRKRKQDKAEKRKQKKLDGDKSVEFMYVDENGHLTTTPPNPSKRKEIKAEDIEVSIPKKLDTEEESRYVKQGYVKFFNGEKGYGFIEESITGENYFVHADNLIDHVTDKDKVTFEIGAGPKGPMANNVKLMVEEK